MDKKNANKAADAKVADAQLGLKNLSLGGPTPAPTNSNNKGKDKETSTKAKKSKKANTPAPSKKISPILLGMPDSPMEAQDDLDPYTTKIGGVPVKRIFFFFIVLEVSFWLRISAAQTIDFFRHTNSSGFKRISLHLQGLAFVNPVESSCTFSCRRMFP